MAERLAGYRDRLRAAGHSCLHFEQELGSESHWREPEAAVVSWIAELPSRCAVFTTGVWVGHDACEAARLAGRQVPEDLGIVTANDDPVVCETADPPLAAVPMPWPAVGAEAARLLDRRLRGLPRRRRLQRVPNGPVILRRSAATYAVDDPELRTALELIGAEACRGLEVEELCRRIGVGRRRLERGFQRCLGRSPKKEIDRLRFERAEDLLAHDSRPISQVASACGFDAPVFSRRFRARYGCAPSDWRATQLDGLTLQRRGQDRHLVPCAI